MPTTVLPSVAMNSFGAYVASVATVSSSAADARGAAW